MNICDFERKWWHIRLDIKDRNGVTVNSTYTTVDVDDAFVISDSRITVRVSNAGCTALTTPPAAWDFDESPGWFIFRPSVEDLGQGNIEVINSYEQAIDISKRKIFEYTLLAAYDSLDTDCTTVGPPDTHCPDSASITIDDINGVVFKFESIDFLEELGCCQIPIISPNEPDDGPDGIRECSRIWFIVEPPADQAFPNLYSWDFEEDPGNELVNRGEITDPLTFSSYNKEYHDLAWDNRDFLWGLEKEGLVKLLIGSDSIPCYSEQPSTISNETVAIFPITDGTPLGSPAMSFSPRTNKLYIAANGRFYELEPDNGSASDWRVTKENVFSPSDSIGLGDLAFDPVSGNCYCLFDDNLSIVNYVDPSPAFGTISYVNDGILDLVGLDFLLDLGSGDFASLYGVTAPGQIYAVDKNTGDTSILSGSTIGNAAVGMSSCQAGEDLRIFPFPFHPGTAPYCFWIDNSTSMDGVGIGTVSKLELVKESLTDFIRDFVEEGDQMFIGTFSDSFQIFSTTSKTLATQHVAAISTQGSTNFCNTIFRTLFDGTYGTNSLRTVIVFGDGAFSDCNSPFLTPPSPEATDAVDYFTRGIEEARLIHDTQHFSVKTILVNTCAGFDFCFGNEAWQTMNSLSQAGGTGIPVLFNR